MHRRDVGWQDRLFTGDYQKSSERLKWCEENDSSESMGQEVARDSSGKGKRHSQQTSVCFWCAPVWFHEFRWAACVDWEYLQWDKHTGDSLPHRELSKEWSTVRCPLEVMAERTEERWILGLLVAFWAIFQDKLREQCATRKQIKLMYKGLFCTKLCLIQWNIRDNAFSFCILIQRHSGSRCENKFYGLLSLIHNNIILISFGGMLTPTLCAKGHPPDCLK